MGCFASGPTNKSVPCVRSARHLRRYSDEEILRIAILGGGGAGVCTALELASHQHHVDIYEQDAEPVQRASRINEGKIHQGFLYAKDASLRTARTMAHGALNFTACLSRWIDIGPDILNLSTPFIYAVHTDTMLNVDSLRRHFTSCCSILGELQAASGLRYLDRDEPANFQQLAQRDIECILNPETITAAFITSERSVDARRIAGRLREAVLAEPRVSFIGGARVVDVERHDGRYLVSFNDGEPQRSGPYDHVVNALWEGRLAIDQRLGIAPPRGWIHRHKFGHRVSVPIRPEDLPSVTMVLGAFGDIVNFSSGGFYLSWYPIGMVGSTRDLQPPIDWTHLSTSARNDVFDRSLKRWTELCPKIQDIAFDRNMVDPSSGIIFAWGETDIDDPDSKLHDRYQIGIRSVECYHSINTGKYTLMPYLALKAAQRVLGLETNDRGLPED